MKLGEIAHARSGDKGSDANVGVIAYNQEGYELLKKVLSEEKVKDYFASLGISQAIRYEMPNILALNFVLKGILGRGGSESLRIDAQGKALGQAILEMDL